MRRTREPAPLSMLFDVLALLSAMLWIVSLASRGVIGIETAGLLLLGVAICVALARAASMSLVGFALRIGLPLASLGTFVAWNTNGTAHEAVELLAPLFGLLVMLLGVYLAVRGALGGGATLMEPCGETSGTQFLRQGAMPWHS